MIRVLLLSSLAVCAPALAQPVGAVDEGHRAFRNKQYDEAAELFEEAGEHYWLGRAQFAGKHYKAARAALQVAFANKPRDAMVSLYLGRACLELKDTQAAVRSLNQAYKRKPQDKRVLFWLGTAYRRAGNPVKAIMPFTELAMLDPKRARARADLGQVLLDAKQPQAAIQAFQDACDRAPRVARHYTWLGISHFKSGSFPGARTALVESLRRNPKDPTAHYWLGRTFHELKNHKKAARAFGEAAKLDRSSATPRLWQARAYVAAGDRAAAIAALSSVAARSRDGALLAYYGRLLAEAKRNDEAATALRKAAELAPKDVGLLRDLAEAHVALDQSPTAIKVLERAVKLDTNDLAAWRRLGGLYAMSGEVRKARDAYRHLVLPVISPTHQDLALLGRAELAARNAKGAVEHLRKSLALRPDDLPADPHLRGDLGIAHYAAGQYESAVAVLRATTTTLMRHSRYLDYLGRALHHEDQKVAAAGVFKRATLGEGGGARAQPYRYLALYALAGKRIDRALKLSGQAVAIAKNDVSCREVAGRVALAAKSYNDAFTHFRAAVKLAPARPALSLLAGRAAVLAGRGAEAEPLLRAALTGNEPHLANLWLGRALLELERASEAVGHLAKAARALPKSVTVWLSLSQAQVAADQPGKAAASLRKALALTPGDAKLYEPLVDALVATGARGIADDERRAWLGRAHPSLVDAKRSRRDRAEEARLAARDERVPRALAGELHLLRAELLEEQGDMDGAQAALTDAERLTPWSYRSALRAGSVAEQLGRYEKAVAFYATAKLRAPNRPEPLVAAARARLGQGHVTQALEQLSEAARAHPKAAEPTVELVRLLSLRDEVDKALGVLESAGRALDDDAKAELRSSRDFSALWSSRRFRNLLGDPVPGGWNRAPSGERVVSGSGGGAYTEAGELVE